MARKKKEDGVEDVVEATEATSEVAEASQPVVESVAPVAEVSAPVKVEKPKAEKAKVIKVGNTVVKGKESFAF